MSKWHFYGANGFGLYTLDVMLLVLKKFGDICFFVVFNLALLANWIAIVCHVLGEKRAMCMARHETALPRKGPFVWVHAVVVYTTENFAWS